LVRESPTPGAHLQGLPNLERLDLRRTDVADAGLPHLKELTNLTVIDLGGTQVTDTGVRELQRALPSSKIIR
jgi:internalin A